MPEEKATKQKIRVFSRDKFGRVYNEVRVRELLVQLIQMGFELKEEPIANTTESNVFLLSPKEKA